MKKLFPILLAAILLCGCAKTDVNNNNFIPVSIWKINGVTYTNSQLGSYAAYSSGEFEGQLYESDYYGNTITIGLSPVPTQNATYHIFAGIDDTANSCTMSFGTQNNQYKVSDSTDKINITFSQVDSINILTVSFTNITLYGLVIHDTTTATGVVNYLFPR